MPLQIAAHKAVIADADFQSRGASIIDGGGAVLLGQRQHAQDAAHGSLSVGLMHAAAKRADLRAGSVGAAQQLQRAQRRLLGPVLVLDAMAAARLAQVLAQQLARARVQQAHVSRIPLHLDAPADPARRRAVVGRLDFHAAIQMHRALAVLVIAEGLDGQWQQSGLLFGEHGRDLPLGGAVDARVGPPLFPVVQVGLRFLQTFEAHAFQRRLLGVADAALDLPLPIRIPDTAR